MKRDYLEIARQVLDRQLVDSNNIPCGKVDDLEMEGGAGQELKIKAILVGRGARFDRLPGLLRRIAKRILGNNTIRVPWGEVSVITAQIKLRSSANELGLNDADRKAARIISKLPGS